MAFRRGQPARVARAGGLAGGFFNGGDLLSRRPGGDVWSALPCSGDSYKAVATTEAARLVRASSGDQLALSARQPDSDNTAGGRSGSIRRADGAIAADKPGSRI